MSQKFPSLVTVRCYDATMLTKLRPLLNRKEMSVAVKKDVVPNIVSVDGRHESDDTFESKFLLQSAKSELKVTCTSSVFGKLESSSSKMIISSFKEVGAEKKFRIT